MEFTKNMTLRKKYCRISRCKKNRITCIEVNSIQETSDSAFTLSYKRDQFCMLSTNKSMHKKKQGILLLGSMTVREAFFFVSRGLNVRYNHFLHVHMVRTHLQVF